MISDGSFTRLKLQHYFLALAHVSLGVLSVVIPIIADRVSAKLAGFVDVPQWIDCVNFIHEKYTNATKNDNEEEKMINDVVIRRFCHDVDSPGTMFITTAKYFPMHTEWFVFTFFVWTGLAHFCYASIYANRYRDLLDEGECLRIRWFEYAFSAGIMIGVIAYLSGIQNISVLIMLFKIFYILICTGYYSPRLPASWFYLVGYFQLLIWIYIGLQLTIPHKDMIENIPWFVFFVYGAEFVLFNSFAAIFIFERRKTFNVIVLETMYNVLSFVSKGLLMAVLTSSIYVVSVRN